MFKIFKAHIRQNFPFLKEKKSLVALSGGIDSVVLAHLLHRLKVEFAAAHCNFKLRGKEADEDEYFCKNWAEEFNIPFYFIAFDTKKYAKTNKMSIQMAARKLRYNWLKKVRKEKGYDFLLTAHHANDNLETFLINLSRGTGLKGLTGISPNKNQVLRPLLAFSKVQIRQYALENQLVWREDISNQKTEYLRNRIRLKIIPELEKTQERFLHNFQQTLSYLNEYDELIHHVLEEKKNRIIIKKTPGEIQFDARKLLSLNPVKAYLHLIFSPYGFYETDDLLNVLKSFSGKQLINDRYRLVKSRNTLFLIENKPLLQQECIIESKDLIQNILNLTKFVSCLPFHVEKQVEVDKEKLIFPLRLRRKVCGDVFYPLGMRGKKKVSKFFKDQKLAIHQKEQVWLLENGDKKIIWIVGMRLDNRIKVNHYTQAIVTINI